MFLHCKLQRRLWSFKTCLQTHFSENKHIIWKSKYWSWGETFWFRYFDGWWLGWVDLYVFIPVHDIGSIKTTTGQIKRLLHDIFHIGPAISLRLPYQARQRSWRTDMGRGLIPGTIWKISCHNLLHWPFPSIEFYIAKKTYEQTNCENKSLRELSLFNLQIFCFESGFKNIPNNVDLYNDVRNCL